jgi:hypothetical protein
LIYFTRRVVSSMSVVILAAMLRGSVILKGINKGGLRLILKRIFEDSTLKLNLKRRLLNIIVDGMDI